MKREAFKAGDRVAMYSGAGRSTGTIFARHDDQVEVTGDASELTTTWHPKQLRRLKRRERRRWEGRWKQLKNGTVGFFPIACAETLEPLVEVPMSLIEARPRKERGK